MFPTPLNFGSLRRQPLESPRDSGLRALNQPASSEESETSKPENQSPETGVRVPSTPSPKGLRSPSLPPPPGPPGTGRQRPQPPLSGSRFPPSSSPILKRRVSEAALASPWQQESILRWEHTAPPQRAPPHPAPPTWGQERVGAPRGRVGFQSEGRDTDARRVRDL